MVIISFQVFSYFRTSKFLYYRQNLQNRVIFVNVGQIIVFDWSVVGEADPFLQRELTCRIRFIRILIKFLN